MDVGRTLVLVDRRSWRAWLRRNHSKEREIWLVYQKKASGKPSVPYNEAVEEALCYGWIDSTVKSLDEHRYAQRFTPRRPGSALSAMNQARVRRLERAGRMTAAGRKALKSAKPAPGGRLRADVRKALHRDPQVWANFQRMPKGYRTIRIGWIEGARTRPEVFRRRLAYFIRMTKKNKRFGMVQG